MVERPATFGGLPTIVVEPSDEPPRFVLVLLHGLMMTPQDLSPFAHSMAVPAVALFPEGPVEAFDLEGPKGRAFWATDPKARAEAIAKGPRDFIVYDPPDLPAARVTLDRYVGAVAAAYPALPIVLGGFSQGAMLTCSTFLHVAELGSPTWVERVRALVLLSGSRVGSADWTTGRFSSFADLLVYQSHGEQDPDLAFTAGVALRDTLISAGATVTWTAFEGTHEIPLVAWRGLRKFLLRLAASSPDPAPSAAG